MADAVVPPSPDATEPDRRPMRRPFVNRFKAPRLTADEADRQGRVTLLAFRMLGGRDPAIAFLNTPDSTLGGRPLDLAIASPAGLEAVEQAIAQRAVAD